MRSESRSKPGSEFRAIYYTFAENCHLTLFFEGGGGGLD